MSVNLESGQIACKQHIARNSKLRLQSLTLHVYSISQETCLWFICCCALYNDGWKSCMLRAVSLGKCTVYRAFVRYRNKNAPLDYFGCCLPCVTPPLVFYQLIGKYRLQMNNNIEKSILWYSFHPFCILKWTNWHINVYVGWMKKANENNSLVDCSSHWVSQAAESSMSVENWSEYLDMDIIKSRLTKIQSPFELFSNIKCHILKLTLFM